MHTSGSTENPYAAVPLLVVMPFAVLDVNAPGVGLIVSKISRCPSSGTKLLNTRALSTSELKRKKVGPPVIAPYEPRRRDQAQKTAFLDPGYRHDSSGVFAHPII